ncbi:MlaD family protein [Tsukamurella ocularis]|uniref:MlaD family protein n=1 Tax=Tsukamurella ocularis TaxID=1970234 RepID=UPI0021675806|nr:MlaD family protein [Tsukamurella ocularis]MCS3779425.1 virulence factor Mce-like protein [Tsukamurella ocularis]MCS3788101.1 virulence factor Mce-like protein [Tsukamurella ocularis]MCS3852417.1 virulence factor Mce-like protein [Tsukamurella ocularis]
MLDANPLANKSTLTMILPTRGQIDVGSPVNLHGIRIGSVSRVQREGNRAELTLLIDGKHQIPANSRVKVEQLSAVGEPFIDFTPDVLQGPYLPDNATVAAEKITAPIETADVFKRIGTLTNAIESNDIAGLLESLRQATSASATALSRLQQSGQLFQQVVASRLPQITAMLAASQQYQANSEWFPGAADSALSALTDVLNQANLYLPAIDGVVHDADVPTTNRQVITPFINTIGHDANRLLVALGPLAAPLAPAIRELTTQEQRIDLAELLANTVRSVNPDGSFRISLKRTN